MTRYHPALVMLHWVLALLIGLALLGGSIFLDDMPNSDPQKIEALQGHMIVASLILLLMLVRLGVRLRTAHPPKADTGYSLLNQLALWAHWALYVAVFGMIVSGITMSIVIGLPGIVFFGSGDPLPATFEGTLPRLAHGAFASILMLLIAGHVAAALYHQFVRKDGLLSRMWFGKRTT